MCFTNVNEAGIRYRYFMYSTNKCTDFNKNITLGSHVGFPISAKNINLVYDHPMNISAKFDSNLFCGCRKKDENVKFP